ncbi:MAG: DUF58 domain-containing protein [Anaerolineales bacterium]
MESHAPDSISPAGQPAQPRMFDEAFLRKLERLAVLSRRAMAGQLQGERRSPKRGQSVEFADFRPYTMGDDIRRIDWNAYARLERFFIKLFIEEEDLTVHLLLDASASMHWGTPDKFLYAQRCAGALGYITLAGLDRITVTSLGGVNHGIQSGYLSPRRGKQQALSLFSFLQNLETGGRSTLGPRLRAYAAGAIQPGPLLLISDLFDETWEEGLRALAARGFEVTIMHILSPDEIDPELNGDLKLRDLETGTEVEITADYDLLQRYRAGLEAWRQEIYDFCRNRGMHYVPLVTSIPIEEVLFAMLRQRGVLR